MPSFSFIGDEPLSTDFTEATRSSSSKLTSGLSSSISNGLFPSKQAKRRPLTDVSNTKKKSNTTVKTCPSYTPKKQHVLNQVKLQWKVGKYCKQSEACRNTIRSALLNGITHDELSRYVVDDLYMTNEVQRIELKRVKDCYRLIKKTLQKEQEAVDGRAGAKRVSVNDYEVVHSISFQRNGSAYNYGCDIKGGNNMSVTQMGSKMATSAPTGAKPS